MNFSKHVLDVFAANETNYEDLKKLMIDYTKGGDLADGITRSEARDKIYDISLQIFGLTKDEAKSPDARARHRAIRDNSRAFFDIIEEVEDYKFVTGFQTQEFFQDFVDYKSIAKGDKNLFLTNDDSILVVTKTAGDHHDITMQPVSTGNYFSVELATYTAKVGVDLDLYIRGVVDFTRLIDLISDAYTRKTQESIYAEWVGAADKLATPDPFIGKGKLEVGAKATFDEKLYNVKAANPDAEVVLLATEVGAAQLNNLVIGGAVSYPSDRQKNEIADTGHLGSYAGTRLITLPNRFEDKSFQKKVFDDNVIYMIPLVSDTTGKPIKFVDQGETTIIEDTDINDTVDEFRTYAVRKTFGVSSNLSRVFGKWTVLNA